MGANLKFKADVARWAMMVNANIAEILQGITTAVHGRLGDATPYLTGRARASWNIGIGEDNSTPAPPLPFQFADQLKPTPGELSAANAFYDPIYDAKHATILPEGTRTVVISNNVEYIELLNAGYSRQAPAGFFEATIAGLESIVRGEIAKAGG